MLMDDAVDNLVYSKRLRKPKGEITLFRDSVKFIRVPTPPPNGSLDAAKDILLVQGATYLRGEGMVKSIRKHDKDPAFAIKLYLNLFGLKFDQQYIDKLLQESSIIIKELKNSFNRPRPAQLAPYYAIKLDVISSRTNRSPSYPGGHSTQSRLIAEVYAEKYPEHRKNLIKAAEESGGGRVMAGYHYPSDHQAGIYLAKRLFKMLKSKKKIQYTQSIDLTIKKRK
jgi:acid phosphatase (class A)